MNRRDFLRGALAVPVAAVLAPLAIEAVADLECEWVVRTHGVDVSTYDAILKEHYGGVFAAEMQRDIDALAASFREDINRVLWMDEDGAVLKQTGDAYVATFTLLEPRQTELWPYGWPGDPADIEWLES